MSYPCGQTRGHKCLGAWTSPNGRKACVNAQASDAARPRDNNGELIIHKVTRMLLGRKLKPTDNTEAVAKELGKTVEWVKAERKRLIAELKEISQSGAAGERVVIPEGPKPFDDSCTKTSRVGSQGPRNYTAPVGPRKEPEYLEDAIKAEGDAHAESLGVFVQIMDKYGWPDRQYWYNRELLGYVEWKTLTGSLSDLQEERIRSLRAYFGFYDVARAFNSVAFFKEWLSNRIAAVERKAA